MERLVSVFIDILIIFSWTSAGCNLINAGELHNQNFDSIDAMYHLAEAILSMLVVIACELRGD